MKKFFQELFKDKKNIGGVIAIFSGLLSIILFLVLPAIVISLTPEGVTIAKNTPEMVGYNEMLNGFNLLFGGCNVDVWKSQASGNVIIGVLESHDVKFNVILLIGLILILFSTVGLIIQLVLKKNNILNKFILGGYIVGALIVLLSAVWFYAINTTILPSSRYDIPTSSYLFGGINASIGLGALLSSLFGIVSSVGAGTLIIKPQDDKR